MSNSPPAPSITAPSLLTPVMATAAMRGILDDRTRMQRMLDFLATLARAEAAVAVIPASSVEPITNAAQAERYDIAAIAEASMLSGEVASPLIKALIAEVAKTDAEAACYVNWGASIQDVADTTLMLELRDGTDTLLADLSRAIEGFASLAGKHRRTAAVARTSLQHALPLPLGLKLTGYASALARSRERLRRLRREGLALQFGGAAGTLAGLGENGIQVGERLSALIDLPLPDAPWPGHSDRIAEFASAFAILTGTCGKIARDVSLLMQTEVSELMAAGASPGDAPLDMPHQRNATSAALALAAATIAPNLLATIVAAQVQEHERGVGGTLAQWQALPALLLVTSGALAAIADIAQRLEVDAERMRKNLEMTNGMILAEAVTFALAPKLGQQEARKIVEEASRKASDSNRHLHDILREDSRVMLHLTLGELARLFELMGYQGAAQTFIDRQIGALQGRVPKRI
jgi:3-carboxy-cis,cis-muconate cycloisomerase